MRIQPRFTVLFTAVTLGLACFTSSAEACDMSKSVRSQITRAAFNNKKRIPLSTFLAKAKTKENAPAAAADTTPPSITGLWSVGFLDGGEVVADAGFEMFNLGGTHLLNDPSPILEGNVCLGAFTQTDSLTYLVNHPSYSYDDMGVNVTGLALIYEKVVLDPSGDTFNEIYHVVVQDLDGNVLATIDGQAVGKRVKGDDNPLK